MSEQERAARERLKAQLNSYRQARAEQQQIIQLLARLEAEATAPRPVIWSDMPKSKGRPDAMADRAVALAELKDRYRAHLAKLAAAQLTVQRMIESLPQRERRLCRCRYIDGLTWQNVCIAMDYSWRQTHNIHAAALSILANLEGGDQG